MMQHRTRLLVLLAAALAVLIAYVVLVALGNESGILEGMLMVLVPGLIDATVEQKKRVDNPDRPETSMLSSSDAE